MYCESHHEEYIQRARLKENCDRMLNKITNGERSDFGGSFESIINSRRYEKFFDVTRIKGKKDTRIYPNIPLIQKRVKEMQTEGNKRVIRIIKNVDTVNCHRSIVDSVPVSESLTRQTTKVRAVSDSVQVSERLGVVVTRANPKQVII